MSAVSLRMPFHQKKMFIKRGIDTGIQKLLLMRENKIIDQFKFIY